MTTKGENLVSRIYEMIERRIERENKIDPKIRELDTAFTRALTAIKVIEGLPDDVFDRLIKD